MKNKIIFYAFMTSLLSASLTVVDASKRMRPEETLDTPTKMRRVAAEPEEALPLIAAPLPTTSPFEALPGELKVNIIRFFNNEETEETLVDTLVKLSQLSKSCRVSIPAALKHYDLESPVYFNDFTPANLLIFQNCRSISYVTGYDPSDSLLRNIGSLGNVCKLELAGHTFTRQGFTQLAHLSAKLVDLIFCAEPANASADDYKVSLGSLTRLTHFQFSRDDPNNEGAVATRDIANALSGLTSLTSLNWGLVRDFNDECMRSFAGATKLRTLDLARTAVTNAIIPQLKHLTDLKKLSIWHTGITQQGKADIRSSMTYLEELKDE